MYRVMSRQRRGISLLEMFAAVVILGIVAAIVLPQWAASRDEARRKAHELHKLEINEAVEQYYINENHWPAIDLSDIGADPNYFPTGIPVNPVTGQPYVLNPTTHRAE